MSRRLDLLLTAAAGWIRSTPVKVGDDKNTQSEDEGQVTREPEAETRAAEIQALLLATYPGIHWNVTYELQRRALVSGPLEYYVLVRGLRRDGTSMPSVRIFWREAARTPALKLVKQIEKGLRLDT